MKQVIKFLMGFMITGVLVAFSSHQSNILQAAETCDSVFQKSDIKLGTVCTKTVKIDTGKADWPKGRESVKVEFSPPTSEWLIRDFSNPRVLSASNGRMKDFNQIPQDAKFDIRSELDTEYQNLRRTNADFKSNAKFPVKGVPVEVGTQTKYLEELEQQNRDISKVYSLAKSNVARLLMVAEANGVCKASLLGKCVDGVGGWYIAEVDVTVVYVGDVQAHLKSIKNTISATQEVVDAWSECAKATQVSSCKPADLKLPKIVSTSKGQKKDNNSRPESTTQEPKVKVGCWEQIVNFLKGPFS